MLPSPLLPCGATALDAAPARQFALRRKDLDQVAALGRFLAGVEQRAYRMARIAVRNDADALDIVQDAMLQLARRYGHGRSEEWAPLFYRILQNRIRDHQRRRKVRERLFAFAWLPGLRSHDEPHDDPIDQVATPEKGAAETVMEDEAMRALEGALAQLPARQREAFMLRNFEGLDVAATAAAMGCSEGSVKTHYSRAVHTLRTMLGEVW